MYVLCELNMCEMGRNASLLHNYIYTWMGTFAETAIVDNHLFFAYLGK
jgi:hypothetical protein